MAKSKSQTESSPKSAQPQVKAPPPATKGTEQAQKMGRIKNEVAQASALVKAQPLNALATTFKEAIYNAKNYIGVGLQNLTAAVAMKDLSPADLASTHTYIKSTVDAVEEAGKFARARVLEVVLRSGEAVGDSGKSRALDLGNGFEQRVTIQKSGIDPKKFEAALRAKQAVVSKYMAQVITFVMLEGAQSADRALQDGVFTQGELDALNYEPSYRVDRMAKKKAGG